MKKISFILRAIRSYMIFFLIVAFAVTCCMLLFLNTMQSVSGLELTKENISVAAKATFFNVILISLVFCVIDYVRRRFTVDRPVKRIIEAAEKVMDGDFTVRIDKRRTMGATDGLDTVIDYFNRMTEELSGTETLRTDFIANVSHELKTPLASIRNYSTLLSMPEMSEEQRMEYAGEITKSSVQLSDLITNILRLSKLENQQIHPTHDTFDLGEQLCACLLRFEDEWERKELCIETDLAEDLRITADAEMLSLVWNNLISNAVKFTPPGGTVSLTLKREDDLAVVEVRDTGCGISAESGKHIFEKFYQGDTSHAMQGNGLGLALVKRVIDIVGGEIRVESEVGKGSTFTVSLRTGDGV